MLLKKKTHTHSPSIPSNLFILFSTFPEDDYNSCCNNNNNNNIIFISIYCNRLYFPQSVNGYYFYDTHAQLDLYWLHSPAYCTRTPNISVQFKPRNDLNWYSVDTTHRQISRKGSTGWKTARFKFQVSAYDNNFQNSQSFALINCAWN